MYYNMRLKTSSLLQSFNHAIMPSPDWIILLSALSREWDLHYICSLRIRECESSDMEPESYFVKYCFFEGDRDHISDIISSALYHILHIIIYTLYITYYHILCCICSVFRSCSYKLAGIPLCIIILHIIMYHYYLLLTIYLLAR